MKINLSALLVTEVSAGHRWRQAKTGLLVLAFTLLHLSLRAQIPLVYSAENTGATCTAPPLPTFSQLPVVQPLTDPFMWSDGRGRSTSFSTWECRRNEIKAEIENYEIGAKPTRPQNITASYAAGILTVNVTVSSQTLTLTSEVVLPTGSGPFPAIIGMNSASGSVPADIFTSRNIATIRYNHNQVTTYGNPQLTDPYYRLYPDQNLDNAGQYSAWAWGVSRLIDGLELVQASLPVNLSRLGVTGCSYAGKMALFSGAFDERIALTIAQESGGGGAPAWRVSETLGAVEKLGATDYKWFREDMKQFADANVAKLPHDHHELMAMIAPRALLVTGNTDFEWLANPSAYVSARAAHEVWKTFGIGDRFGFYIDGGHNHCAIPTTQRPAVEAFVDKFLVGNTSVNTNIMVHPYPQLNYQRWYQWWGTNNPVLPAEPLGKRLWLEAECATVGSSWDVVNDADASNGKSVRVKAGLSSSTAAPTSTVSYLTMPFTIDSAATYNVVARQNVPAGEECGYWLKVDNEAFQSIGSQLIGNAGFENGLTGWTTLNSTGATISANTVAAEAHTGTGSMKVVNPTAQPGNQWRVQVSSAAFSTTIGKQYTISYWVRAAAAGGSIRLSTGPSGAQYQADQTIGTAWQQVTWTITASLASTTFLFDMGQVATTYYIDDVSVKEVNAGSGWSWTKLKDLVLPVGAHTLTIAYNTGGGAKLDKLVLATSMASISGLGGAATNCTVTANTPSAVASGIEVYPNPAHDKLTVVLGANPLQVRSIEVLDVTGRVLSTVDVGPQTQVSIARGLLRPGIYVLRFHGSQTRTQRIVIQ
ncbi:glucuronyl esterase domain-containing protein [Hymenobacter chitinivorans]|uniref:Putative secreted protein (Por secretion system target) n=1 Tax=Hymenobacter chitinivorans DSM 11115 TaxID=1121954 RepID=A0A2M9BPS3_9BACT|nr:T9SS type A sorting domain-containing protein [Hymenobacter chitinivorans]PJJ59927.1 putative secreted protein (Por secretion system target) [Hymenobacter chitinivorans DSM 11115]